MVVSIRSRQDSIFPLYSCLVILITYRFESIIVPPVERQVSDFDPTPRKKGQLDFCMEGSDPIDRISDEKDRLVPILNFA